MMSNSSACWKTRSSNDEMMRHLVLTMLIQTQCAPARRHQVRFRLRISARKERHVVALSHQFLSEVRHHALRSPVVFRRHAFIKRRHLCNSQLNPPLLKFLDPAGSIFRLVNGTSTIDAPLGPRDQFSRPFMFEYADENTCTFCCSFSIDASDLTYRATINEVALREQLRSAFYRRAAP
jgi:hypothetical protein